MIKGLKACCMLIMAIALLVGCSSSSSTSDSKSKGSEETKVDKLVMAYLPMEGAEGVQQSNKEFQEGLSKIVGVPVETFKATSYNAAIEAMKNNKADMVLMPPFAYLLGKERANIEPLAKVESSVNVVSSIIVAKESDIKNLEDLKSKTFGFIEPSSSSGHLLPKTLILKELGLNVDELEKEFFKDIKFVGNHESAVIGVVNGQYDAASVASPTPEALVERGMIDKDSYRIIAQSEPSPGIPFAVRSDLPQEIKDQVRDYLINYKDTKFIENYLGLKGATFVEAKESDYDILRDITELLNMSPEELLKQ
jgi:phosphonate transport system substrate-binding protein